MAENKQYVTQTRDNGSVLISEDVITTIVAHAVEEVEGVVSLNFKPGADIIEMIGKKGWSKGLKITIGEDDILTVDCNITVAYGQSVVSVAGRSDFGFQRTGVHGRRKDCGCQCECMRHCSPIRGKV